MKEYATYIFDLDGTLLNTLTDLAGATNHALRIHGMPVHTEEAVRGFVGNGVKKLIERAVPGGEANPAFEEVYRTFREYYLEHSLDNTRPYPGIMDVLAELKARGKKLAVVSNKFCTATEELCRHFFGDYITVAIGEREGIRRKPWPDTVVEAMNRLGTGREGTVYIGDSDVDIATARNSGLPCISVLWGFRGREFLMEHGGTVFISEPRELLY